MPVWRSLVVEAAKEAIDLNSWVTIEGACRVEACFFLPRPKTVKRDYPIVPPDSDKLARGILDALTVAKVYVDDSQVVDLVVYKRYADSPGAVITVTEML